MILSAVRLITGRTRHRAARQHRLHGDDPARRAKTTLAALAIGNRLLGFAEPLLL